VNGESDAPGDAAALARGDGVAPAPARDAALAIALTPVEALRGEIEAIDQQLIQLLARRISVACSIGEAKRAAGLPVLDPAREAAIVRRASASAREAGIDDEDVRYIFWHVVGMSRRAQLSQ
jgi:chorismate mutase